MSCVLHLTCNKQVCPQPVQPLKNNLYLYVSHLLCCCSSCLIHVVFHTAVQPQYGHCRRDLHVCHINVHVGHLSCWTTNWKTGESFIVEKEAASLVPSLTPLVNITSDGKLAGCCLGTRLRRYSVSSTLFRIVTRIQMNWLMKCVVLLSTECACHLMYPYIALKIGPLLVHTE